jgi:hypothetical protein
VHLVGFIIRKFVTMHGHMNVKLVECSLLNKIGLNRHFVLNTSEHRTEQFTLCSQSIRHAAHLHCYFSLVFKFVNYFKKTLNIHTSISESNFPCFTQHML